MENERILENRFGGEGELIAKIIVLEDKISRMNKAREKEHEEFRDLLQREVMAERAEKNAALAEAKRQAEETRTARLAFQDHLNREWEDQVRRKEARRKAGASAVRVLVWAMMAGGYVLALIAGPEDERSLLAAFTMILGGAVTAFLDMAFRRKGTGR